MQKCAHSVGKRPKSCWPKRVANRCGSRAKILRRARRARRRSCASFAPKVARVFCNFCVDFAHDARKNNAKMRALGRRAPQNALQIDAEVVRNFYDVRAVLAVEVAQVLRRKLRAFSATFTSTSRTTRAKPMQKCAHSAGVRPKTRCKSMRKSCENFTTCAPCSPSKLRKFG